MSIPIGVESSRGTAYGERWLPSGCVLVPLDNLAMFLNDNIRKCVCFVAGKKSHDYQIGGTAFFMVHGIEGTSRVKPYAVTARHVINDALEKSMDRGVYLRVNTIDGNCRWMSTQHSDWEFHEDERVDLAAMSLDWSDEDLKHNLDHLTIHSDWILTDELMKTLAVTPGEELFFPSLFVRHFGQKANVPIIRTGNIAALPTEPIRTKTGQSKVYLAEARSIGGHSGSPVFVHFSSEKKTHLEHVSKLPAFKSMPRYKRDLLFELPMLGVVHGHFSIAPDQFSPVANAETDQDSVAMRSYEDFNSGIAVIIPASAILELLNQKRFVDGRARDREALDNSQDAPIPD